MINNVDGAGDLGCDSALYFRCVWVCQSSKTDEAVAVLHIFAPLQK